MSRIGKKPVPVPSGVTATVSGQTRLGVIGTTARWLMPQFLGRLGQQHPNVRIIIQDGATSTLVPNLLSGQLNAAVIHLPVDDPELVIEPLFAEDLLLLADKSHPLAKHDTIALADLDDVPLLLPPTGSALRRVLDRAAATADITLRPQAEIDGVRLLASLAIDGFGASIVPATAAAKNTKGHITLCNQAAKCSFLPCHIGVECSTGLRFTGAGSRPNDMGSSEPVSAQDAGTEGATMRQILGHPYWMSCAVASSPAQKKPR